MPFDANFFDLIKTIDFCLRRMALQQPEINGIVLMASLVDWTYLYLLYLDLAKVRNFIVVLKRFFCPYEGVMKVCRSLV